MVSPAVALLSISLYIGLLFLLALHVERKGCRGAPLTDRAVVYSLSLALICTAWSFYGNTGSAAQSGMFFVSGHLGSSLGMLLCPFLLRKLVRIKEARKLTSVADLVSARYGKSEGLAALVTVIGLIGLIPYIALQFKAITGSYELLVSGGTSLLQPSPGAPHVVGPFLAAALAVFTIAFGLRRVCPTERHPGLIMALSVECLVKLIAMVASGVFVTYALFNGFGDILGRLSRDEALRGSVPFLGKASGRELCAWVANMLLGFSAVLFLPRQFHVAVVENVREAHLRTAMWLFPLYLLLFNLFVFPIAMGGLLLGHARASAETFVLLLPLAHGPRWLSLLVFVGGFSAATGMIMLETVALSTMITNHLILPLVRRARRLAPLLKRVLEIRWVVAAAIVLSGYLYMIELGRTFTLSRLGLMSHAAVLQLLPSILGGLYWCSGNKAGACLGMLSGFAVFLYTLMVPVLCRAGWLSASLLQQGPFGLAFLRPEQLFGLSGLDPVTHAVFWSLGVNAVAYMTGSLCARPSHAEEVDASSFVGALSPAPRLEAADGLPALIDPRPKRQQIEILFCRYLPEADAAQRTEACFLAIKVKADERLTILGLAELQFEVERTLGAAIGVATAHAEIRRGELFTTEEEQELSCFYCDYLAQLRLSPVQFARSLEYYKERVALLAAQAAERERLLAKEKAALSAAEQAVRIRDEFISIASHEMKSPITPLLLQMQAFQRLAQQGRLAAMPPEQLLFLLKRAEGQLKRLARLVDNLLDVSRISAGRLSLHLETLDLSAIVCEIAEELRAASPRQIVEVQAASPVMGRWDRLRIEQVVTNLLGNAMKFGEGKPIHVALTSTSEIARLTIRDEGIGISGGDQARIFERFEQAVSCQAHGGLGLGLFIVRQIVLAHGGNIEVQSAPSEGSVFTVELPQG